ncbi:MAG: UDP-N-acetylglucosamine 2-epimerase, partial [Candidatus Krumholzibacteria bacterium]|nr:UDP-N-acetylglucosamine 2-epimerase [Candidatus Krumholzibacteria bacterium]
TERPITIDIGTNRLVGTNADRILSEGREALQGGATSGKIPELWDGKAAERIVKVIDEFCL